MIRLSNMTKDQMETVLIHALGRAGQNLKVSKYNGNFKISADFRTVSSDKKQQRTVNISSDPSNQVVVTAQQFKSQFKPASSHQLAVQISKAFTSQINQVFRDDCKTTLKMINTELKPSNHKEKTCLQYYQDHESEDELVTSIKQMIRRQQGQLQSMNNTLSLLIEKGDTDQYQHLENQIGKQQMTGELVPGQVANPYQIFTIAMLFFSRAARFATTTVRRLAKSGQTNHYDPNFGKELFNWYRTNPIVEGVVQVLVQNSTYADAQDLFDQLNDSPSNYLESWHIVNAMALYLLSNRQDIIDQAQQGFVA